MTAGNTNQKKTKNRVPRKARKRAGAIRGLGSQKSLPSHWWNSKLVVVPPHVRDFVKAEKVRLRNNQESRRFERTDDQEEVLEALGDHAQAICEHLKKLLPNFENSGVVTDEDKNLVNDALTACPHVNAISINTRAMVGLSGATQHVQNEHVRCRDSIELALRRPKNFVHSLGRICQKPINHFCSDLAGDLHPPQEDSRHTGPDECHDGIHSSHRGRFNWNGLSFCHTD